jgi:acyl carrier protein
MPADDARARVLQILHAVAPEIEIGRIREELPYRQQFVFDSVDFLSFALKLQETFKIAIPENDYPRLASLKGCLQYLSARRAA